MFSIDDKETKRLENELGILRERALPFATKETLNRVAFLTQKKYQKEIKKELILRNKFTERSIRVEQAKGLNIRNQMSIVGSVAPYMGDQEFGGIKTTTGRKGVPIPTSYSAGLGRGAQPRTKLPRKPNKLRNISMKHKRRKAKNRKQALLFKVQDAVESGNRFVFHNFGNGSQGIFKVIGGRRGFKKGWPAGARLEMIHDLSRMSVSIPKEPMLQPAYLGASVQLPRIYRDSLLYQIKRNNLFK